MTPENPSVSTRIARLRPAIAEASADAMVITGRSNVRYLTGFTGSAGLVVLRPDDAVLVTDGRYTEQAAQQVQSTGVPVDVLIAGPDQRERVVDLLAGCGRVAWEGEHLSWAEATRWIDAIDGAAISTTGLVETLRELKDADEIDRIRRAASIVDAALDEVLGMLARGVTELAFAAELDAAIRRHGATGNSFDTIVAAGPNAALPHARPSDRVIERGELVVVDVGAVVEGYCSDMTRTFCVGRAEAAAQQHFDVVVEAQAAGVAALGPGVDVAEVDAACRAVIGAAGWADHFTHGTGHGVGLDIHEAPRVAATGTATLQLGHVVTVEPGVYLPNRSGVRVEDLLVITESGAEPLTLTPKTLTPDVLAAG